MTESTREAQFPANASSGAPDEDDDGIEEEYAFRERTDPWPRVKRRR